MILITGANGHLGNLTIDFLQKKQPKIRLAGLVRSVDKGTALNQKGVEIRIGDYYDIASLEQAFAGIETLLLVSSGTLTDRFQQHKNAVDAAVKCGVKNIVYTSLAGASANSIFEPGVDHFQTEEYIKASGLNYTFLRNTFYFEVIPLLLGNASDTGQINYPAGNAKINAASRVDMAEANANVLLDPAAHRNKSYEITADRAYNFNEIAALASAKYNRTVNYVPVSPEDYRNGLIAAGVPDAYLPMYTGIGAAIAAGELSNTDESLARLLNHPALTLQEFMQQN